MFDLHALKAPVSRYDVACVIAGGVAGGWTSVCQVRFMCVAFVSFLSQSLACLPLWGDWGLVPAVDMQRWLAGFPFRSYSTVLQCIIDKVPSNFHAGSTALGP